MNCPEVMELMQRHLDEDLDQKEEAELAAHLQGCLDCRLMLERLQELSDELAQLPKVLPPFSLVDSILPQLDAIDRQASGQPEALAALGHIDRTETGDSTVLPFDKSRRERRAGSPISWKVAGGVVAAGLIIGLFAFNVNQPSTKNADMAPELAQPKAKATEQRSAAAAQQQADDQMSIQDQRGDDRKQDYYENASASGGAAVDAPGASSDAGPELVEPQAVKPQASLHFSADAPASEPSPPGTALRSSAGQQPAESADGAPAAGGTGAGVAGGGEAGMAGALAAPAPAAGGAAASGGGAASTAPAADAIQGLAPSAPGDSAAPNAADAPQTKAGSSKLMLGPAAIPVLLASPSGAYVAAIEDRRVVIRQAGSQELVFASERVWGEGAALSLAAWSQDDQLTYRVENGDRTLAFVIDVKAHTEAEAAK